MLNWCWIMQRKVAGKCPSGMWRITRNTLLMQQIAGAQAEAGLETLRQRGQIVAPHGHCKWATATFKCTREGNGGAGVRQLLLSMTKQLWTASSTALDTLVSLSMCLHVCKSAQAEITEHPLFLITLLGLKSKCRVMCSHSACV